MGVSQTKNFFFSNQFSYHLENILFQFLLFFSHICATKKDKKNINYLYFICNMKSRIKFQQRENVTSQYNEQDGEVIFYHEKYVIVNAHNEFKFSYKEDVLLS